MGVVSEDAILMDRHSVRRLPVVDSAGFLCGVIARADVVRVPAAVWRGRPVAATL